MSKIKEIRNETDLTQKDLAMKSGVSIQAIRNLEQSDRSLFVATVTTILRISSVLEIEAEDLYDMKALQEEVKNRQIEFQELHPNHDTYDRVTNKYMKKLSKWKERKVITDTEYKELTFCLNKIFKEESDLKSLTKEANKLLFSYSPRVNRNSISAYNFFKYRYINGISMEEISYCTGISVEMLRRYQSNLRNINSIKIEKALKISIIFNVKVSDLFVIDKKIKK